MENNLRGHLGRPRQMPAMTNDQGICSLQLVADRLGSSLGFVLGLAFGPFRLDLASWPGLRRGTRRRTKVRKNKYYEIVKMKI